MRGSFGGLGFGLGFPGLGLRGGLGVEGLGQDLQPYKSCNPKPYKPHKS